MIVLQTVSIIIALILSAYSFTIIDSLDDSSNAGADGTEVLVKLLDVKQTTFAPKAGLTFSLAMIITGTEY